MQIFLFKEAIISLHVFSSQATVCMRRPSMLLSAVTSNMWVCVLIMTCSLFCITLHSPSSWYFYPVLFCEHSCCQLVSHGLTMCGHTSESWWTSSLNRFLLLFLPPSLFLCCDQICAVTYLLASSSSAETPRVSTQQWPTTGRSTNRLLECCVCRCVGVSLESLALRNKKQLHVLFIV